MQILPTQNYILCSVHEGKAPEGLHLPDGIELQPYAQVMAIGPNCKTVNIDSKVLFSPESVIYYDTIDGQKIVIVSETAVFAICSF